MNDPSAEIIRFFSKFQEFVVSGVKEIRPWDSFFQRFAIPKADLHALENRIFTNLLYWRWNYAVVYLVLSTWTLFRNPKLLIVLPIIILLWSYFFLVRKTLTVGSVRLDRMQTLLAVGGVSFVILYLFGVIAAFLLTFLSGFAVIGLHAIFRPSNNKANLTKMSDNLKTMFGLGKVNEISNAAGIARSAINGDFADPESAVGSRTSEGSWSGESGNNMTPFNDGLRTRSSIPSQSGIPSAAELPRPGAKGKSS